MSSPFPLLSERRPTPPTPEPRADRLLLNESAERGTPRRDRRLKVVQSALGFLKRTIRAVRIAATDKRIPKPLRGLAVLGLTPIPGPFDEVLLLIVAVPLALFYREPLADAWGRAGSTNPS